MPQSIIWDSEDVSHSSSLSSESSVEDAFHHSIKTEHQHRMDSEGRYGQTRRPHESSREHAFHRSNNEEPHRPMDREYEYGQTRQPYEFFRENVFRRATNRERPHQTTRSPNNGRRRRSMGAGSRFGHRNPPTLDRNEYGSWPWPDKCGPGGTSSKPHNLLYIAGARRWFDEQRHLLDLTCSDSPIPNDPRTSYPIKWLHVQRYNDTTEAFDEFRAILSNAPSLSRTETVAVLLALKEIRKSLEISNMWTAKAVHDEGRSEDESCTVTALSIPFFTLGPKDGHGAKGTSQQYPISSLYHWHDASELSREWDIHQSYPHMSKVRESKNQIVYVPHVWMVIVGKYLVTYGPVSFEEIKGETIRINQIESDSRLSGPKVVSVTDDNGGEHVFDIRECRTYFELRRTIQHHCLRPTRRSLLDYTILLGDASLTANKWISTCQSECSDTIALRLERRAASRATIHVHTSQDHAGTRDMRFRYHRHHPRSREPALSVPEWPPVNKDLNPRYARAASGFDRDNFTGDYKAAHFGGTATPERGVKEDTLAYQNSRKPETNGALFQNSSTIPRFSTHAAKSPHEAIVTRLGIKAPPNDYIAPEPMTPAKNNSPELSKPSGSLIPYADANIVLKHSNTSSEQLPSSRSPLTAKSIRPQTQESSNPANSTVGGLEPMPRNVQPSQHVVEKTPNEVVPAFGSHSKDTASALPKNPQALIFYKADLQPIEQSPHPQPPAITQLGYPTSLALIRNLQPRDPRRRAHGSESVILQNETHNDEFDNARLHRTIAMLTNDLDIVDPPRSYRPSLEAAHSTEERRQGDTLSTQDDDLDVEYSSLSPVSSLGLSDSDDTVDTSDDQWDEKHTPKLSPRLRSKGYHDEYQSNRRYDDHGIDKKLEELRREVRGSRGDRAQATSTTRRPPLPPPPPPPRPMPRERVPSESSLYQEDSPTSEADDDMHIADVPPFLSWAAYRYGFLESAVSHATPHDIYVNRILEAIHETLCRQTPVTFRKLYRRAREVTQKQFEDTCTSDALRDDSFNIGLPTPTEPVDLHRRESFVQAQHKFIKWEALDPEDRVQTTLMEKINDTMGKMYSDCKELMSYYSQSSSLSTVMCKCFGTFENIMGILNDGLAKETEAAKERIDQFWVIRDPSCVNTNAQDCPVEQYLSWNSCRHCLKGEIYKQRKDAVGHVAAVHFRLREDDMKDVPQKVLVRWVRTDSQYRVDQRLEMSHQYIDIAYRHLHKVFNQAKHIRRGVSSGDKSTISPYLPRSLLRALERIVMLLVLAARSILVVNQYCNHFDKHRQSSSKESKERAQLEETRDDLDAAGHAAVIYMEKAEQDLTLYAHTNSVTDTVSYDAVSVEYLLATIVSNLLNKPFRGNEDIEQVYASFIRNTHLSAVKHPRSRIIRDIWCMREELQIIKAVNYTQWQALMNYASMLDRAHKKMLRHDSHRSNNFHLNIEKINQELTRRGKLQSKILTMLARLEEINRYVVQMLEIRQESNSNAIIVFTLVTIVFLPLSWATSYLGMNTADIRILQQGQWLYWSIALPITSLVIGLALLVVFKGEWLRELIIERNMVRTSGQSINAMLRSQSTVASMARMDTIPEKTTGRGWVGRAYVKAKAKKAVDEQAMV